MRSSSWVNFSSYRIFLNAESIDISLGTSSVTGSIWGYCLIGRLGQAKATMQSFCAVVDYSLDKVYLLCNLWEVEEPFSTTWVNREDEKCESFYKSTVALQLQEDICIVRLPFYYSPSEVDNSRTPNLRGSKYLRIREKFCFQDSL